MRLNLLVLAMACLLPLMASYLLQQKGGVPVVKVAATREIVAITIPHFSFPNLKGKKYDIRDFKGRVIILNFWATWCAPCVVEFPNLLELAEENPDVVLIALSTDDDAEKITRFVKKLGKKTQRKNVIIGRDADLKISQDIFQTFRLPETILIDKELIARAKIVGGAWNVDDVGKQLKEIAR